MDSPTSSTLTDDWMDDTPSFERVIWDPIHEGIKIDDPLVAAFIDTPQFQRLRYLHQLGTTYFVFPGASHNRFEHCLGVSHLARKMVDGLRERQPSLGITKREVLCVQLAGLCHDLGHGPFSHLFDGRFIPEARPDIKWSHEVASEMMLEALVKENNIPIERDWLDFIRDLIQGVPELTLKREVPEKAFLFEIVANKRNGIDVDKFDYIARDTHNTGIGNPISTARLMASARVVDNQICYSWKDIFGIHELFHARFSLHKRIYKHHTSSAISYMIVDALLAADPVLKISERIDDPAKYLYLTDGILQEIEQSTDPALEKSRQIIRRIRKRNLYKMVDHKVHPGAVAKEWKKFLTAQKVVDMAVDVSPEHTPLQAEDVIVSFSFMDYGMKDRNPLDFVRFYNKTDPNVSSLSGRGEGSQLVPEQWQELTIRCFTRDPEKSYRVQAAFRAAMKTLPQPAVPAVEAGSTSVSTSGPSTPPPRAIKSQPGSYSPHEPNQFTTLHHGYKPQSPLGVLANSTAAGVKRMKSGETLAKKKRRVS